MITRLRKFNATQGGSAMTEFVITLPVWIIVFYGIWDISHFPVTGTKVQGEASINMWTEQFDPDKMKLLSQYSNPLGGAASAATSEVSPSRTKFTGRESMTKVEGVIHAASLGGVGYGTGSGSGAGIGSPTLTEAGYRSYMTLGAGTPDTYVNTDELVDDTQLYPLYALNDGVTEIREFTSSGGLSSKIAAALGGAMSQSGSILALTAGARYGAVHGSYTEAYGDKMTSVYNLAGIKPASVYDSLVAPRPLQDKEADMVPWGMARLLAEGREQYSVALRFGESEWSDSSEPDLSGLTDDIKDEDDIREENEQLEARKQACSAYPVPPSTGQNNSAVLSALGQCEKCLPGNRDCSTAAYSHCNSGDCKPPDPPP